ncbi:MAG: penicillin-binding protein 1C [bacterium]|nr:penicillin-binding protein 1C [bacterium]
MKWGLGCVAAGALGALVLELTTLAGLRPLPETLEVRAGVAPRAQILDRGGLPLTRTFDNKWNLHDAVPLHAVPELLRSAFIEAEDQRFFEHDGVDWKARFHAVVQNLRARRAVRGASTITEQVVRMLHDRKRTVWSRWLEGFEAQRLERSFSKGEILEFYLNQVPYARRRRGVVQAARDYFDRDLETLNEAEQLALVVLVRSPSRFDLKRSQDGVLPRLKSLAARMHEAGLLEAEAVERTQRSALALSEPEIEVRAPHFVQAVRDRAEPEEAIRVGTTLDGALQSRVRKILESQIAVLAERQVSDGAALIVNHRADEVLAWVNAGAFEAEAAGSQIDAVLTPRQPGSTLKPFVYALALEQGWTAATVIDDAPFKRPVGRGQHAFRNYSRRFYGPVRLRSALGNSLNIPAVRAAAEVTPAALLARLQALGFESLDRHPDFYGEGLALGNGEVSLLELVSAYAILARGGLYRSFRLTRGDAEPRAERQVFDREVSSLIADILSDPEARRLEFSANGVLSFPTPTAVKTGTSNDYRDAWAVGFSDRYTAGVWMGNLDLREMQGVSGAQGPAVVLRAIFSELERESEQKSLYLSPKLGRAAICSESGSRPAPSCPTTTEWFRPGRVPLDICALHRADSLEATRLAELPTTVDPSIRDTGSSREAVERESVRVWLAQPSPGLNLAQDPRIPDDMEAFPFEISGKARITRIEWLVDGIAAGKTGPDERRFLWPLAAGRHEAQARVWTGAAADPVVTAPVAFYVR